MPQIPWKLSGALALVMLVCCSAGCSRVQESPRDKGTTEPAEAKTPPKQSPIDADDLTVLLYTKQKSFGIVKVVSLDQHNLTELQVAGKLDDQAFGDLGRAIKDVFAKKKYRVIINLSKSEFISSVDAGLLNDAKAEAEKHGGKIVLVCPPGNVYPVLELLGLTHTFEVVSNIRAAIRVFR